MHTRALLALAPALARLWNRAELSLSISLAWHSGEWNYIHRQMSLRYTCARLNFRVSEGRFWEAEQEVAAAFVEYCANCKRRTWNKEFALCWSFLGVRLMMDHCQDIRFVYNVDVHFLNVSQNTIFCSYLNNCIRFLIPLWTRMSNQYHLNVMVRVTIIFAILTIYILFVKV
jgi:hypothetical protein